MEHMPDFVAVGGRIEAIEALMDRDDSRLTEDERAQATLIRQVVRGEVTDEAYKRVETKLGVKATVEFVAFSAYLCFIIRIIDSASEDLPTWGDVIDQIRAIKKGTFKIPAPTAGIA
jgi:hypothetical protein